MSEEAHEALKEFPQFVTAERGLITVKVSHHHYCAKVVATPYATQ